MEANRKEDCNFDVIVKGRKWHINTAWIQPNGEVAWFDASTERNGVTFYQIFSPDELEHPQVERL